MSECVCVVRILIIFYKETVNLRMQRAHSGFLQHYIVCVLNLSKCTESDVLLLKYSHGYALTLSLCVSEHIMG